MSVFVIEQNDVPLGYFTTRELARNSIIISYHKMKELEQGNNFDSIRLTYRDDRDNLVIRIFTIRQLVVFDRVEHL